MKKLLLLACMMLGINTFCMNPDQIAKEAYDAAGEHRKPTQADLNNPDCDEEFTCGICFEKYNETTCLKTTVRCQGEHKYCKQCLDTWFEKNRACPTCREEIPYNTVPRQPQDNRLRRQNAMLLEGGIAVLFGIGANYCLNTEKPLTPGQKCVRGAGLAAVFTAAHLLLAKYNKSRTTHNPSIAATWTAGLAGGFMLGQAIKQETKRNQSKKKGRS